MSDKTNIEWTDATWNPITGCSIVSPGCTNCYAMKLAGGRLKHHPSRAGLTKESNAGPVWTGEVRLNQQWLVQPLGWRRPRHVFVCAHGDLFHPNVPDEWIDRVFAVMQSAPRHTFQILTKRADRAREYLTDLYRAANTDTWFERGFTAPIEGAPETPFANVWIGVSVEDQHSADERIPQLLETPAALRFLSCEPLLGPVDLKSGVGRNWIMGGPCWSLDWIIVGGESGPNARPSHPDWIRSLRDQCREAHVPFFFKQWGEYGTPTQPSMLNLQERGIVLCADGSQWNGRTQNAPKHSVALRRCGKKAAGRALDGEIWDQMPEAAKP
jgi:protein gp37